MKNIQRCFYALCFIISIFLAIPVVDREWGEIKTIVKRRVNGFEVTGRFKSKGPVEGLRKLRFIIKLLI